MKLRSHHEIPRRVSDLLLRTDCRVKSRRRETSWDTVACGDEHGEAMEALTWDMPEWEGTASRICSGTGCGEEKGQG